MNSVEAGEMRERALVYRMLGRFFLNPLAQDELDALDADMFRELAEAAEEGPGREGYEDMYRYLRRRNTATCQDLRADFTQTFLGAREYQGVAAVPYESQYLTADGEGRSAIRLKVLRIYKRSCVKLDSTIELPEDHLSFEMEYLAILADRAADALEAGRADDARQLVAEQRDFLHEHVLSWYGRFYNLSCKLIQTRFYQGVLKVAKDFLEGDGEYLNALVGGVVQN